MTENQLMQVPTVFEGPHCRLHQVSSALSKLAAIDDRWRSPYLVPSLWFHDSIGALGHQNHLQNDRLSQVTGLYFYVRCDIFL